ALAAHFALGRAADGMLAAFAQSAEVFLDAQQDAAGAGFDGATMRLDIGPARFAHRGDLHERRLAGPREIGEVHLDTFDQPVSSRLRGGAISDDIATARLDDRGVLSEGGRRCEKNEQPHREIGFSHLSLALRCRRPTRALGYDSPATLPNDAISI